MNRRRRFLAAGFMGGGLARPSAPSFTLEAGMADGEVILTVTAVPASWGDLAVPGDDGGTAGIIEAWNAYDGWFTIFSPSDTGAVTLNMIPSQWGSEVQILVRGVSAAGVKGATASELVTVPGSPAAFELVTNDGVTVTHNGQAVYILV